MLKLHISMYLVQNATSFLPLPGIIGTGDNPEAELGVNLDLLLPTRFAAAYIPVALNPGDQTLVSCPAQAYIGTGDYLEAELDVKRGLQEEGTNTDLLALNKKLKASGVTGWQGLRSNQGAQQGF